MRADASFNKDSLMIVLSKLSDSSQLKLMDTWSHEHLSRDFSKDYIDMLYIKSKQLNNKWFLGEAYYLLFVTRCRIIAMLATIGMVCFSFGLPKA